MIQGGLNDGVVYPNPKSDLMVISKKKLKDVIYDWKKKHYPLLKLGVDDLIKAIEVS